LLGRGGDNDAKGHTTASREKRKGRRVPPDKLTAGLDGNKGTWRGVVVQKGRYFGGELAPVHKKRGTAQCSQVIRKEKVVKVKGATPSLEKKGEPALRRLPPPELRQGGLCSKSGLSALEEKGCLLGKSAPTR